MSFQVQTSESLASGYPSLTLPPTLPGSLHRPSHLLCLPPPIAWFIDHGALGSSPGPSPPSDHSRVEELVQLTPSLEITPPTPTTRQAEVAGEAWSCGQVPQLPLTASHKPLPPPGWASSCVAYK